jgi:hypothetical protein
MQKTKYLNLPNDSRVKTLRNTKNIVWLLVFVLVLFIPLILEFIYLEDFASTAQRVLPYWRNRSTTLLLSDMLFLQGGALILFGALVAGTILYNAWAPTDVRRAQFTEYIWNWKVMDKERGSTKGALPGLILIGAGIAYIIVGIFITL